jgi:hypothetical protein
MYTPDPTKGIKVYVDANFSGDWDPGDAMNADNVDSWTGYVIWYAGCPIYWQTKLQTEIALSTAEAEYIGNVMNADNVYSWTGYVIRYAGCPIYWQTKLQTEIALSTAEAEYIVLSQALRETLSMTNLIKEINVIFLFTYRHQGLSSRLAKIISHVLQLHKIPSSLLEPSTLQINIITFASM